MPTLRMKLVASLLAAATVSTAASAQTFAFARAGTAPSTTQELLSSVNVSFAMPVSTVEASRSAGNDLISESMPSDNFGSVSLHESTANEDGEAKGSSEPGFFSTNTGRASLIGLVGLAGAGYVAFNRGDNGASVPAVENRALPISAAGFAAPAAVIVNPEPATMALMGLGLAALGLAARRRRNG